MATIADVKRFFEEGPNGRKVTVKEIKKLNPSGRDELKKLYAKEIAS